MPHAGGVSHGDSPEHPGCGIRLLPATSRVGHRRPGRRHVVRASNRAGTRRTNTLDTSAGPAPVNWEPIKTAPAGKRVLVSDGHGNIRIAERMANALPSAAAAGVGREGRRTRLGTSSLALAVVLLLSFVVAARSQPFAANPSAAPWDIGNPSSINPATRPSDIGNPGAINLSAAARTRATDSRFRATRHRHA